MKNFILGVVIVVTSVVVSFTVAYLMRPDEQVTAGSTAGTTFNTAKYAGVTAVLSAVGSTGTSTSVLNSDASDRIVTGVRLGCTGVGTSKTAYTGAGLAALTLAISTSTAASPAVISNTNYIMPPLTIGTSTAYFTLATSTAMNLGTSTGSIAVTGSSAFTNIWLAGSYMTFATNATNTAACTFGVDYLQT